MADETYREVYRHEGPGVVYDARSQVLILIPEVIASENAVGYPGAKNLDAVLTAEVDRHLRDWGPIRPVRVVVIHPLPSSIRITPEQMAAAAALWVMQPQDRKETA